MHNDWLTFVSIKQLSELADRGTCNRVCFPSTRKRIWIGIECIDSDVQTLVMFEEIPSVPCTNQSQKINTIDLFLGCRGGEHKEFTYDAPVTAQNWATSASNFLSTIFSGGGVRVPISRR